jgi:GNAT superfamily N-acetyltransferase
MTIELRRIRAGDGAVLRSVRLAALLDEPSAFARSHAEEVKLPAEQWARAAAERAGGLDHATFFALEGHDGLGLVGGHRQGDVIELVSMWTSPVARGQGLGAKLVNKVIGEVAPLPSDPCKDELRMRREPI